MDGDAAAARQQEAVWSIIAGCWPACGALGWWTTRGGVCFAAAAVVAEPAGGGLQRKALQEGVQPRSAQRVCDRCQRRVTCALKDHFSFLALPDNLTDALLYV